MNALLATPAEGYAKAIYHNEAPEAAHFPFVVFSKSTGIPIQSQTLPAALSDEVWMVKAVDRNTTADIAEAIAARLGTLLDDASLSISGRTLSYLRRQSDIEYPEVIDGKSYRHVGGLYRLVYS